MSTMGLGRMTLRSIFKKPETTLYPFEKKPQPSGLKGHIENDVSTCVLCGVCARSCPTDAIVVERDERTWSIDHFLCIQCGYCVQSCPKQCLTMDPNYTVPATEKSVFEVSVPDPHADSNE